MSPPSQGLMARLAPAVASPGVADVAGAEVDALAAAASVVVASVAAGVVRLRLPRVAQLLHKRLPAPVIRRVIAHPRRPYEPTQNHNGNHASAIHSSVQEEIQEDGFCCVLTRNRG
jgi:hypothetical protein